MEKEVNQKSTKKEQRQTMMKQLEPYRFRILWTGLLLIVAILFLTVGFWKTILFLLFGIVGCLFGKMRDEDLDIYSLMDTLKTKWGL